MNVAGIDVSTHNVDIVKLPFDNGHAHWDRYELTGSSAFTRACNTAIQVPRGTYWDDVALVAIERPYGPGGDTLFHLHVVVGCLIAALPERLRPWILHPTEWRKACGLPGNATKDAVSRYALWNHFQGWPNQDACDAYCVAVAARAINEKGAAIVAHIVASELKI